MTSLRLYITITCLCLFCMISSFPVSAQVSGCKDPAATNYDPAATVNNGSCAYSSTFYTPVNKVNPLSNSLTETSGLQWAGNYLWTLNDGGSAAAIYRIDTTSNAVLQTVNLGGTTNVDWEDLSFDGTHFYIGDFGNNRGGRRDLKIYKFPLSAIPGHVGNTEVTIPSSQIEVINFTYSDQPQPAVATVDINKTQFDCEAMVVDGGKIHLFSKNWIGPTTTHYVINGTAPGSYEATVVETLSTDYLVTAASKVPGSSILVLLGYENGGFYNHFMHLLTDFNGGRFFNGNKRLINLPNALNMGQAEGITFRNSTYGYISNEAISNIGVSQKLKAFHTDAFTPAYVLPAKLKNFKATKNNNRHDLSWSFTEPVDQLKVLSSSNGINFTTLIQYARAMEGAYSTEPVTNQSCYKLAWQNTDGSLQYSTILCLNSDLANNLHHFALRRNGDLSFTFSGNEKEKYLLRLLNVQGQLVAQTEYLLTPGPNTVRLLQPLNPGNLALLQAVHKDQQQSLLLHVQ